MNINAHRRINRADRSQSHSARTSLAFRVFQWCTAAVVTVGLLVSTPAQAQTPKRVALLIGNSSYTVGRLTNPPNDVREMESALKSVGLACKLCKTPTKTP